MSYRTNRLDEHVMKTLRAGGVGFMPSDTIYGLSCRALDKAAVERIYRLKKRDSDKPLIVLIANKSQLGQLEIDESQVRPALDYWPGALTLICETPSSPAWLHRGTKSLAVRIPGNEALRSLIAKTGPLVSTSANTQGEKPINSIDAAEQAFNGELDFYVDGGDLAGRQPSTLARAVNGKLEVIRPGAVKIKED